jgi:hypothetical protein
MFDSLIQSSLFPALLEIIRATDASLAGVKARLEAQAAGPDHVTAMLAKAQLDALSAWEPALRDIMKGLDKSHQAVHGTPLPGHGAH